MNKEIEVKFYPVDVNDIEVKLHDLGAKLVQPRTLMTRIIYGREKNPQIPGNYLRIRNEGGKITLSIKVNGKKDGKILDQKELLVNVDSLETTKELFDSLGFTQTNFQENYRTTWAYDNSEIVIDEWPALDAYIEIESASISDLKRVIKKLGLDWEKKTIVSVDELYASKYGLSKEDAISQISFITFKNIPSFKK